MMIWKIKYTKRFLKELADLPQDIQNRVQSFVFEELETENPFQLNFVNKMKGYKINIKFE